ncbi:MAG: DUF2497 domain-containing protein [Alphaproteobacteria bacterium]|nr:DUF2497 domain-containing protein [Alphaproteobacteria bacterium]MBQ9235647.1 DUF2497 domain-containing protein [Alphaproteobacteria bacterium]
MAENNDDLEVENILSSIKSILEEDEGGAPEALAQGKDALEEVLQSSDDDILELSQDMRIDEAISLEPATQEVAEQVSAKDEIVELKLPETASLSEVVAEDVKAAAAAEEQTMADVEEQVPEVVTDVVSEPEPDPETTDVLPEPDAVELIEPVEPEPKPELEVSAAGEIERTVEAVEVIEPVVETAVEAIEPIEPAEEREAAPMEAAVETPEVVVPIETEPEDAPSSLLMISEDKEEKNSAAVDASANIISNFAKMFAKNKSESSAENKPVITAMGDGTKTLESFVKDAIVKVIGDEISLQWNNGADYREMAEAEIRAQVKNWVDNNLAVMVERIVKQEIERVIAKAGS